MRYRLQDRGAQRWIACPCGFEGPTLTVAGREVASYDVPGVGSVASQVLSGVLDRPAVERFQVAQDPDGRLSIRWTSIAGCRPGEEGELRRGLAEVLGGAFRIEACDRIAVPGGKLLRFVTAPRSSANDGPS